MFRLALVVASAVATRVEVEKFWSARAVERSAWGASCDDLQENFRGRVAGIRTAFDAIEDYETASRWTSARMMMRAYGLIRTMRRAESCSWVQDDSSEDMADLREVIETLIAANPCAEVARAQLNADTTDDSADDEISSIQRALWALTSDDCNTNVPVEELEGVDADRAAQGLRDAEDNLVDSIEQLEEESESSLIQTDSKFIARLFRAIGVVFLLLLFASVCTGVMAFLGLALGFLAVTLSSFPTPESQLVAAFLYPFIGFYGGAALGLLGCMYRTLAVVLPQLTAPAAAVQ